MDLFPNIIGTFGIIYLNVRYHIQERLARTSYAPGNLDEMLDIEPVKPSCAVKIEMTSCAPARFVVACAVFLIGSALSLSVGAVLAKDIEDIEADIAEELEESIAAELEEQIEEETSGKAEEDIMEDLAEDIQDDLEEQMKLEERLQRDQEDDLEEALKIEQDMEEDLADELEKAEKDLVDDLERVEKKRLEGLEDQADATEDAAKEREKEAEQLDKKRQGRPKGLAELDEFLEEHEEPAIPGERLFLVEADEVQRFEDLGVDIAESRKLEGLGLVLLTVRGIDDDIVKDGMPKIPDELDDTLSDRNHLYTLDSEPGELRADTIDLATNNPARYAGILGLPTPILARSAIGLIDTAVDTGHPCLKDARIEQASFVPDAALETTGHGTSVASILLADAECGIGGLLAEAPLFSASVFFRSPLGGETATVGGLVRAIDWLIRNDVRVINLSLSGPPNELLHRAVQEAAKRGILVVAAVGNAGPAAPPRYPAAYAEAIGITAADRNNIIYRRAGRGDHVAFTAPGVDVAVAIPGGFALRSGTSIATPFASALLLEAVNSFADPELLQRLEHSTLDLGAPGFDEMYGHGLLQMPAVRQARVDSHEEARDQDARP